MSIDNLSPVVEKSQIMPEYFWEELEESNHAKAIHAPLALILQAEEDITGAFSGAPSRAKILTIAKTHRVAFKMIGKKAELGEKIQETKQQLNHSIDLLVICAHGSPDAIYLGTNEDYTAEDLRKEDFDGLSTMGKIILCSCCTGQVFAPQLAKIAKVDVIAPIFRDDNATCILYSCEEHGVEASSIRNGDQNIRIFHPNQEPTMPCIENPRPIETLENLLIQDAMQGNVQSQWALGFMYWSGLRVEKSSTSAVHWLGKAVEAGSVMARMLLGGWYSSAGDVETAQQHLLLAAKALLDSDTLDYNDTLGGVTACKGLVLLYKDQHLFPEESLQILSEVLEKMADNDYVDEELLGEIHKNVGDLYMDWIDADGTFAPQYTKAFHHYNMAVEYGLWDIKFELGKMYERGLGVEASQLRAIWEFESVELNGSPEVAAKAKIELERIRAEKDSRNLA